MNVNNYGFHLYFATGFDLSPATNLTITFTRPDGSTFTRDFNSSSPVFVGQVDVETTAGLFPALQYAGYFLQNGDINQVGEWSARCTYDNTVRPEHLTTDIVATAAWTVNP